MLKFSIIGNITVVMVLVEKESEVVFKCGKKIEIQWGMLEESCLSISKNIP